MNPNTVDGNSMLQVGTLLRKIYRIDTYLSSGGFGNTYVATNVEFDEQVAIKEFFMKGLSQRDFNSTSISIPNFENIQQFEKLRSVFKREAKRLRRLGKLNNPHIVKVYDIFEENNTTYYVMQFINGSSFAELVKQQNAPIDSTWLLDIFVPQVLDALEELHENKIWHLDIKPANIMADSNGNILLIDFGSSKQVDPNSGDPDTISSFLMLTRPYAPIELKEYDYKKIGPWTDIYSLGATLYNLATLQRPPRSSELTVDGDAAFKFLPGTNETFKQMVMWMMSTSTEKRPQSVAQIKEFIAKKAEATKPDDEALPTTGAPAQEAPAVPAAAAAAVGGTPAPNVDAEEERVVQLKKKRVQPSQQPAAVASQPAATAGTPADNGDDTDLPGGLMQPGGAQVVAPMVPKVEARKIESASTPPAMPPAGQVPPANMHGGGGMMGGNNYGGNYGNDFDDEPKEGKSHANLYMLLSFIVAGLITGLLIYLLVFKNSGNDASDNAGDNQKTELAKTTTTGTDADPDARVVTDTVITCKVNDSTVTYTYTGPIKDGLPNGRGKGKYSDGTYDGPYDDGVRDGDSCIFVFSKGKSHGDKYEGSYDDDRFEGECRYTQNDGYYFEGTARDGKLVKGTWYDKRGNVDKHVDGGEEVAEAPSKDIDWLYIVVPALLFVIAGMCIFLVLRRKN